MELRSWGFSIVLLSLLILWNVWQSFGTKELVVALIDDLKSIKDQLAKAKSEIVSKVSDLEAALADSGTESDAVTEAVSALKDVAQALDDVVPDQPAPVVVPVDPEAAPVQAGTLPTDTPVVEVPAGDGPAEIPSDGVPIDAGAINPNVWVTPVTPVEDVPVEDAPSE